MAIGKVIKGESGGDSLVERPVRRAGVVNAEEFSARQTAQGIIADAKRSAEQILAQAEADRDRFVAEAREEGRQQGLASVSELLTKAHQARGQLLEQAQPLVLDLALQVAAKVIGRDLERDPSLLLDLCATAIENVRNVKSMVLRVHPKASSVLRERKADLMQLIGRTVDVAIKDDPDVEPLGCVIQTEFGTLDAQLTTQLQMLQDVLVPDTAKKDGPQ